MHEKKTAGLKKHSEELNKLMKDSLQTALLELIKVKSYDEISITELCKKAGVSRMAFYGNFQSKTDVIKRIVIDMHKKVENDLGSPFRATTTLDWYANFFYYIESKAELLSSLFKAGFKDLYLNAVNEIVLHDENIPDAERYRRLMWSGGIENAVFFWLSSSTRPTPEEMAVFCEQNLVPWGQNDAH